MTEPSEKLSFSKATLSEKIKLFSDNEQQPSVEVKSVENVANVVNVVKTDFCFNIMSYINKINENKYFILIGLGVLALGYVVYNYYLSICSKPEPQPPSANNNIELFTQHINNLKELKKINKQNAIQKFNPTQEEAEESEVATTESEVMFNEDKKKKKQVVVAKQEMIKESENVKDFSNNEPEEILQYDLSKEELEELENRYN